MSLKIKIKVKDAKYKSNYPPFDCKCLSRLAGTDEFLKHSGVSAIYGRKKSDVARTDTHSQRQRRGQLYEKCVQQTIIIKSIIL